MPLTRGELDFLRDLFARETGIMLGEERDYLFHGRLAEVCRRRNLTSMEGLLAGLRADEPGIRDEFVSALTTNETSFFRDPAVYEVLREEVLPELVRRKSRQRCLTIWSAACSTGQEPYSLAMLIRSHFPELLGWQLRILATDVSAAAVARAQAGCYTQAEVNRGLPVKKLLRYFRPSGREWQLAPEVTDMVQFARASLLGAPPLAEVDVIMCRHVLIYFTLPAKQRILSSLRQCIDPQGFLLVGGPERLFAVTSDFAPVSRGAIVYYRPAGVIDSVTVKM